MINRVRSNEIKISLDFKGVVTIRKINRKYVLTIFLTFIFAFSSLSLDALSFVGINMHSSTIAFAKSSSSRSGFSSSKSISGSSKSSSGFSSGFFSGSSSSSKSSTGTSNDSTSSKSGEGFKSGNFSSSSDSSSTKSDSSASNNANNNNTQTYNTNPGRNSFWPFFGWGGGYFRPFYFGSMASTLINTLVLAGILVLAIILIKKYLNNKRR